MFERVKVLENDINAQEEGYEADNFDANIENFTKLKINILNGSRCKTLSSRKRLELNG